MPRYTLEDYSHLLRRELQARLPERVSANWIAEPVGQCWQFSVIALVGQVLRTSTVWMAARPYTEGNRTHADIERNAENLADLILGRQGKEVKK